MKRILSILPFIIILLGISFLLYPTVGNFINRQNQSRLVAAYQENANRLKDDQKQNLWEEALQYNKALSQKQNRFSLSDQDLQSYRQLLNIDQTGIMASVKIPKLSIDLPVYHGVEEEILQVGAGHLPGSSLPVGGENSHCVISGHSGLASARLFTDLDKLKLKDFFELHTLGKVLTYEVDQIVTVLPKDLKDLEITKGKDFCTLITCTPYGINSHRLLVRGHRKQTQALDKEAISLYKSKPLSFLFPGIFLLGAIILSLLLILYIYKRHSRKRK